jgi:hypothetical protein
MRAEVMKTFQQLENFWPSSSFRAICNAHAGIRKMRESPKSDDTGGGQEYG